MSAATTQMAEVKVATRPTVQAAAGIPSRPGCRGKRGRGRGGMAVREAGKEGGTGWQWHQRTPCAFLS